MKQQFIDRAQLEVKKDMLSHKIDSSKAEAVVERLIGQGFDIKTEYKDTVVKMEVTLKSGKTIRLQADYKNVACGYDNLFNLLTRLQ